MAVFVYFKKHSASGRIEPLWELRVETVPHFATQDGALDVVRSSTENQRGNAGVQILASFWITVRSYPEPSAPVTFELQDLENWTLQGAPVRTTLPKMFRRMGHDVGTFQLQQHSGARNAPLAAKMIVKQAGAPSVVRPLCLSI